MNLTKLDSATQLTDSEKAINVFVKERKKQLRTHMLEKTTELHELLLKKVEHEKKGSNHPKCSIFKNDYSLPETTDVGVIHKIIELTAANLLVKDNIKLRICYETLDQVHLKLEWEDLRVKKEIIKNIELRLLETEYEQELADIKQKLSDTAWEVAENRLEDKGKVERFMRNKIFSFINAVLKVVASHREKVMLDSSNFLVYRKLKSLEIPRTILAISTEILKKKYGVEIIVKKLEIFQINLELKNPPAECIELILMS